EEAKAKTVKGAESIALDKLAGGANELQLTLKALGVPDAIKLSGTESQYSVSFSFHTLDVVSKLRVRLKYIHAAKLLPESSSLKIMLNEQEVGSIPLLQENAGKELESTVEIDPLMLQEWNNITFKLLAHMEGQCDDPRSPAIWLSLNHIQSSIEATTVTLPLANDLEFFPMPFFDRHDTRDLSLPFVFSSKPSWEALKAAGIMASWFGSAVEWRKAQFPTYLNSIPELDAIVFATSQDRIEGVELPLVTDGLANISLVNNPRNPNARLLLVVGRGERDLVEAAKAITLGKVVLDGTSVNVQPFATPQRGLFDAPRWIDPNKILRLVDLVPADQLRKSGLSISPLQLNLSLPPNLYKGETTTIPFNFMFEASNINDRYLSRIDAVINGIPFQTVPFKYKAEAAKQGKVQFNIPMRHVTGKDTVTLQFTFAQHGTRKCGSEVANDEIRIDPKSTIDLTSIPRYMELPDLSHFAYTGFPYSKQADLSGTAVLLPEQPDSFEIEAMLTAIGHIGNKTGYPATALTVASVADAHKLADKDLLVIGATGRINPLLNEWKHSMPVDLLTGNQPWPYWGERFFDRWTERAVLSAKMKQDKERSIIVMAGFRSPLDSDRSAVVLAADSLPDLSVGASALNTFNKARNFRGDIAVIGKDGHVTPFNHRMHHYSIGKLPFLELARRAVWHSPWLAILCASIYSLFFAAIIFRKLRKLSEDKLKGNCE
ncbi:MAG: cellulose biosynthesis cyclic di-GMP-binding regulatory protein BcsB, partial [Gallionellaceae bacterium]|nr:cellulose biosynthesis cyclic di-GMP-binding regulatory protein BcsB [Gallionellaceae bacterium]